LRGNAAVGHLHERSYGCGGSTFCGVRRGSHSFLVIRCLRGHLPRCFCTGIPSALGEPSGNERARTQRSYDPRCVPILALVPALRGVYMATRAGRLVPRNVAESSWDKRANADRHDRRAQSREHTPLAPADSGRNALGAALGRIAAGGGLVCLACGPMPAAREHGRARSKSDRPCWREGLEAQYPPAFFRWRLLHPSGRSGRKTVRGSAACLAWKPVGGTGIRGLLDLGFWGVTHPCSASAKVPKCQVYKCKGSNNCKPDRPLRIRLLPPFSSFFPEGKVCHQIGVGRSTRDHRRPGGTSGSTRTAKRWWRLERAAGVCAPQAFEPLPWPGAHTRPKGSAGSPAARGRQHRRLLALVTVAA